MMRLRMSLTQSILIPMLGFLIIQAYFFAQMESLLSQAETSLEEAVRAKDFTDQVNELSEYIYRFVREMSEITSTRDEPDKVISGGIVTLTEVKTRFKNLKKLTDKDDVKKRKMILNGDAGTSNALSILENLKSSGSYGDWPQDERRKFRAEVNKIRDVGKLNEEAQLLSKQKFEQEARLRSHAKVMLIASLVFVAISTVLVALFLLRHISWRVNTIHENFIRFAAGAPLTAPIGGSDELAELDATFHTMARQLADARQKENALLNRTVSLICTIDRNGRFTSINPASAILTGYQPDDLTGLHYKKLVASDDDTLQRVLQISDLHQLIPPFEATIVHRDGSYVYTLWSVRLHEDNSFLCVIHDITEKNEAERMRKDVVKLITADLQHPLKAIRDFLNRLSEKTFSKQAEKGAELLALATRSSQRMSNLVNDLIDSENIESGSISLNLGEVSVAEILASSVAPLQAWAGERGVKLQFADRGLKIKADEERIGRVLSNLVSNAVKFSPKDSTVSVEVEERGDRVEFRVTDQGRGIPADSIDTLFERFKQASDADRKVGTGLGLAICKDIVELHGGSISVTSQEHKGSTFLFTVPRAT